MKQGGYEFTFDEEFRAIKMSLEEVIF